jgi:hypothetical protein
VWQASFESGTCNGRSVGSVIITQLVHLGKSQRCSRASKLHTRFQQTMKLRWNILKYPRKTNLPNAPRSTNHTPYTLIPSLYSATPKPSIVTTSHCFRTSGTNCDSSPNCWINDDKTLCSSSPRRPQARFVCSCFGSSLQGRCTLCSLAERFF